MASDHDELELNQVLTFKDDTQSLAHGESETINGASWASTTRLPMYGWFSAGNGSRFGRAKRGRLRRWADSFRRDPDGRMTPDHAFVGRNSIDLDDMEHQGRNYYNLRAANYRTAHPLLAKELKGRHLQMIAIGGSIGEYLFARVCAAWPVDVCVLVFVDCVVFSRSLHYRLTDPVTA